MSTENTYKFPFFGAGEATYFDWSYVKVIFKETPSKEQKKLIQKNVPFPIREIAWEDNDMTASSSEFTHVDIADTYKTKDGLDPTKMENWQDD